MPVYFPQVGSGDGAPGSIPGQEPMQMHGFARNMEWEIVKTVRRLRRFRTCKSYAENQDFAGHRG